MVDDVKQQIDIKVNVDDLDKAIEKANRLVELLREAQNIVNSLFRTKKSKT